MTDPFEARLQRALDHAARQLEVRPVPWRGVSGRGRRRPHFERLAVLAGVAVTVIVAAVTVALIGHRNAVSPAGGASGLPPAPAAAFEPHLPPGDLKLVLNAWSQTVHKDRACRGDQGPRFREGSPSSNLRAMFGILRQPANATPAVRRLLKGPVWTPGGQLYLNQVHIVSTQSGATLYILPAGNVSGQRGVPTRCAGEETRTLRREVSKLPAPKRSRILEAQARYLAYLRYGAQHPEGICAAWAPPGTSSLAAGDTFVCSTLAELERWGVLADASAILRGVPTFWTVVPDAVAVATLHFSGQGTPLRHRVTVTARPVDNVVTVSVPHGRFGSRGGWADAFPSRIALGNSGGRIIRNYVVTPNMPTLCGFSC